MALTTALRGLLPGPDDQTPGGPHQSGSSLRPYPHYAELYEQFLQVHLAGGTVHAVVGNEQHRRLRPVTTLDDTAKVLIYGLHHFQADALVVIILARVAMTRPVQPVKHHHEYIELLPVKQEPARTLPHGIVLDEGLSRGVHTGFERRLKVIVRDGLRELFAQ